MTSTPLAVPSERPEWLRRDGTRLADATGRPVLLRGTNVGNWLLPEGYMWRFADPAASPRAIETLVRRFFGHQADEFWQHYLDRFITEADIAMIASYGWNSVRLPLNARWIWSEGELLEPMLRRVDDFVAWCAKYGLYAILDLHAAPGGQTGTNIDDSAGYPDLFTDPAHADDTVALWQALASRYADEPTIGAYDLLNEPLPGDFQYQYGNELVNLYRRILAAIREVDQRHLIILEGPDWAKSMRIFTDVWDDNTMLSFHRYGMPADRAAIKPFLQIREQLQLPLYVGEAGENTRTYYQLAFQLYDDLEISWSFWPWKKLGALNCPVEVRAPDGWDSLCDWTAGRCHPPERAEGQRLLTEYLDRIPMAACTVHTDVLNSVNRRAPLRLQAECFGFRGPDVSFGTAQSRPQLPGFRDGDAPQLSFVHPRGTTERVRPHRGHLKSVWPDPADEIAVVLSAGDWVRYDVDVPTGARLSIGIEGDAAEDAKLTIAAGSAEIRHTIISGAGWRRIVDWQPVERSRGRRTPIKIVCESGTVSIRWLDIDLT